MNKSRGDLSSRHIYSHPSHKHHCPRYTNSSTLTSGGKPPYSKSRNKSVYCPCISPQIFMGAPNSNSIGWLNKTSLAWLQRLVASCTLMSTGVPGFLFLADKRLSIIPSIHDSSGGALLFWRIIV